MTTCSDGGVPRVDFVAEAQQCPSCGMPLFVYKTQTRLVTTLSEGGFRAREVIKSCRSGHCPVVRSEALVDIVPPGQRYGWDVIVHVGLARYLRCSQREEIRADLRSRGIEVSAGTVSHLCDRFLVAFGKLHEHRAPALREAMKDGYWLHVDATCDLGKGGLFACLEGRRGWVLLTSRIPAENSEALQPLVEKVVRQFGEPIATVRDLGEAMARAVQPLRERGVPDLLCHFHFLAALGKKLFDKPYSQLRNRVRASRVNPQLRDILRELERYRKTNGYDGRFGSGKVRQELLALVLWLVESDGTKAPAFPFGLPSLDLVRRCQSVREQADSWVPTPRTTPEHSAIRLIVRLASKLARDEGVTRAIQRLEDSWLPFSELREVLRLSACDLALHHDRQPHQPRLPALELLRSHQIETALIRHHIDLRADLPTVGKKRSSECPHAVIVDYLDRWKSGLVGHPAIRDRHGDVVAVVDRTNNISERFFSHEKQRLRRRVGRALLGRDMELQPAQAALTHNLLHPDYVRIVCGSLDNLPSAFAKLNGRATATTHIDRDNRWAKVHRDLRRLLKRSPAPLTTSTAALPTDC